jgi:hypothetical protein
MTVDELQALIADQTAFKKAFRKIDRQGAFSTDPRNEMFVLLKDQFKPGRTPYLHQVVFPDGSQLRLKFVDTIKKIYDSKGRELMGRESYLTYVEVVLAPAGKKPEFFTMDVSQVVWAPSKPKATEKYNAEKAKLVALAEELGIDLSAPTAWCTTYSQNY